MSLTRSHATPTPFLIALAVGAATSVASANFVIDDFAVAGQSLSTASTTSYSATASPQSSAANAAILPVVDSMNRRSATAGWTTRFSENNSMSQADRLARSTSLLVDTALGRADFRMNGRLTTATVGLAYNMLPGTGFDLAALGTGIRLDGSMTTMGGFSNAMLQGLALDVVLADTSGVTSNFTWFGNTATGGFTGLNGTLEATWADFAVAQPGATLDLGSISRIGVTLSYSFLGLSSSPSISATYSLNSIALVPAPAAAVLLACMPALGGRRRRA